MDSTGQNRKDHKMPALIALTRGVSVTEVCEVLNVTRESLDFGKIRLREEGWKVLLS
jgi:hypothetical protein